MRHAANVWPSRPAAEYARLAADELRTETAGGMITLAAVAAAVVWATLSAESYTTVRAITVGPPYLELELREWVQRGPLALFFFVAALQVKKELGYGELAGPRRAALPLTAAVAGMALPVLGYALVAWGAPQAAAGWAVPLATDVAVALAVPALTARLIPAPLRALLLTCAVLDALVAVTVIAVWHTGALRLSALAGGVSVLACYGYLQHRRVRGWWLLLPVGLVAWYLVQRSGVHPTAAGAALGLLTRAVRDPDEDDSPAERADHLTRPTSAGLAVPAFALFSAGVPITAGSLDTIVTDRVVLGVVAGLVAGKFLGMFGGAWLAVRLGMARLSEEMSWKDLAAVSVLSGAGFTASLLLGDLAYGDSPARAAAVTSGVLAAALVASGSAVVLLRGRVRGGSAAQDG